MGKSIFKGGLVKGFIKVQEVSSLSRAIAFLSLSFKRGAVVALLVHGRAIHRNNASFVRRKFLVHLIASFLEFPKEKVVLSILPNKKPVSPLLFFNHSNKKDAWLYAFAKNIDLGVDLEQIDCQLNYQSIIKNFFSLKDQIEINQIPDAEKRAFFFAKWTKKEAIAKCWEIPLVKALKQSDVYPAHSLLYKNFQMAFAMKKKVPSLDIVVFAPATVFQFLKEIDM